MSETPFMTPEEVEADLREAMRHHIYLSIRDDPPDGHGLMNMRVIGARQDITFIRGQKRQYWIERVAYRQVIYDDEFQETLNPMSWAKDVMEVRPSITIAGQYRSIACYQMELPPNESGLNMYPDDHQLNIIRTYTKCGIATDDNLKFYHDYIIELMEHQGDITMEFPYPDDLYQFHRSIANNYNPRIHEQYESQNVLEAMKDVTDERLPAVFSNHVCRLSDQIDRGCADGTFDKEKCYWVKLFKERHCTTHVGRYDVLL